MKKLVLIIFVALFSLISNSESNDLNQIYSSLGHGKMKILFTEYYYFLFPG